MLAAILAVGLSAPAALTWGAPTPSDGQQLAPLWTADRSLAP